MWPKLWTEGHDPRQCPQGVRRNGRPVPQVPLLFQRLWGVYLGVWDGMPWRNDQLLSGWWYSSLSWGDQWQKSMAMFDHGRRGTESGWRRPAWHWCEDLETLHMVYCWTKLMVSAWREGHQNRLERSWMVAVIPGWPALGELWIQCITWWRRLVGT